MSIVKKADQATNVVSIRKAEREKGKPTRQSIIDLENPDPAIQLQATYDLRDTGKNEILNVANELIKAISETNDKYHLVRWGAAYALVDIGKRERNILEPLM